MSYQDLIRGATGVENPRPLALIEDVMRTSVFHSTLDHIPRPEFEKGARVAWAAVQELYQEMA